MKDPAFLFYPGDYLRDTQCLSEKSQVAYDRIMCEHMRNICISKQQLTFFTKRLTDEEKSELMFLLTEINNGFQITWVAESILKRRNYSDSRRKNRISKSKIISSSYDPHMENENENENEIVIDTEKGITKGKNKFVPPSLDQVINYCNGRQNNVDPVKWLNFYQAKDWMIGKNKMKDWKAAVRTWENNNSNIPVNGKQQIINDVKYSNSNVSDDYKKSILDRLLYSTSSEEMS